MRGLELCREKTGRELTHCFFVSLSLYFVEEPFGILSVHSPLYDGAISGLTPRLKFAHFWHPWLLPFLVVGFSLSGSFQHFSMQDCMKTFMGHLKWAVLRCWLHQLRTHKWQRLARGRKFPNTSFFHRNSCQLSFAWIRTRRGFNVRGNSSFISWIFEGSEVNYQSASES